MRKAFFTSFTIPCLLFTVFLLGLSLSVDATPEQRTIGVNLGDSFLYNVSYLWESNDPSPQLIWPYKVARLMLEVNTITNTIFSVESKRIGWDSLLGFKNGTSQTMEGNYLNVETGANSPNAILLPFGCISTNSSEGDLVYTGVDYRINETVIRTYLDEERYTNHLYVNKQQKNFTMDAYWDYATGVLVEFSVHQFNESGGYTTQQSLSYQLVDTNLWVVPEFSSFLILSLFMIATLLAALIHRKKQQT